jgi:hypothetical protein
LLALYRRCTEERVPLLNVSEPGRTEVLCLWSGRVKRYGDEISLAARCENQVDCFHRFTLEK